MKRRDFRALFMTILLAVGPATLAQAAQLVTFTRGQSIVVQSVEKRGNWYYFTLEGGGEMGVPAGRVSRIEDYEAPPPSLAAAPSAPMPAPSPSPQPAPSQVNPENAGNAAGELPPATGAPGGEADSNVVSHGNDWRFKARMSGGPRIQQGGGGLRKPGGLGGGTGVGRLGTYPNPYNRRPPVVPPQQPGNPTQ